MTRFFGWNHVSRITLRLVSTIHGPGGSLHFWTISYHWNVMETSSFFWERWKWVLRAISPDYVLLENEQLEPVNHHPGYLKIAQQKHLLPPWHLHDFGLVCFLVSHIPEIPLGLPNLRCANWYKTWGIAPSLAPCYGWGFQKKNILPQTGANYVRHKWSYFTPINGLIKMDFTGVIISTLGPQNHEKWSSIFNPHQKSGYKL